MSGESQKPAPAPPAAPKTDPSQKVSPSGNVEVGERVRIRGEAAVVTYVPKSANEPVLFGLLIFTSAEEVMRNGTSSVRVAMVEADADLSEKGLAIEWLDR